MTAKAKTDTKKTAKSTTSADFSAFGAEQIKENFEKAFGSFGDVNEFGKDNFDAIVASANAAGKTIEALNTETAAFAQESYEKSSEATKAAFAAKSVQELVEIQSEYTKEAFETYMTQVNKLMDLVSEATADVTAPLNARVNAVVEKVQGA